MARRYIWAINSSFGFRSAICQYLNFDTKLRKKIKPADVNERAVIARLNRHVKIVPAMRHIVLGVRNVRNAQAVSHIHGFSRVGPAAGQIVS